MWYIILFGKKDLRLSYLYKVYIQGLYTRFIYKVYIQLTSHHQ